MSTGIKSKLNIYNQTSAKNSVRDPAIYEESDSAYSVTNKALENPSFGTEKLSDFQPYTLSPLLEISAVPDAFPLHPHDVLFFDTETTGLSRGTGTLLFLIGFAWIRKNTIHIRQYFLKNPAEESQMLDSVTDFMSGFSILSTFNGKSFDIPLLRNRLILNRRKLKEPLIHFDLLHIYRKLFPKDHWKKHSQSAMEQAVLNFTRECDISGSDVPQIYFDYIRYGEKDDIAKVMRHNELDVTGLVFLFLKAAALYQEKNTSIHALRSGIARILIKNQRFHEASSLLHNPVNYKDYLHLAYSLKKSGNFSESANVYHKIFSEFQCPFSLHQLIKLYEHKLDNSREALRLMEENRSLLENYESPEKFLSRYKRLTKKSVIL